MNKNMVNALFLIVGILFGIVLTINIKYPFNLKTLDEIKTVCQSGQTIKSIRIDVTGKVKQVTCENSTVFNIN